jgi:anti-anti-sigma regulatory factor
MLRTTIVDTPSEQKWILQGRLAGQWATDLKACWAEKRGARHGRKCVVDLEDVTFIDSEGEGVLLQVVQDGAELVSSRAYVKHLLAELVKH